MKAVVTVIGQDRIGIIYDVSKILFDNSINILDISQTILNGYFTMMMVTDLSTSKITISELKDIFDEVSKSSSLDIRVQHEEIFNSMHRL